MGRIIAAPAATIPLAEAKAFLRIATSEEDAVLAGLLRTAVETCEAFTGRMLLAREVKETVSAAGGWTRLGAAPVSAIEAVTAVAADGTETLLDSTDFGIDIDAAGEGWVRCASAGARLKVDYRAGLAEDWNGIPEPLRHGIMRLAAHLHGERIDGSEPPAAVTALWRPWRRMRLS